MCTHTLFIKLYMYAYYFVISLVLGKNVTTTINTWKRGTQVQYYTRACTHVPVHQISIRTCTCTLYVHASFYMYGHFMSLSYIYIVASVHVLVLVLC